jgi:RNA recognition motif-containing protein
MTDLNNVDRKENQVFIRNLSYDATSDDLLELFQDIGPIKRTSIASGDSKGFGFVKL